MAGGGVIIFPAKRAPLTLKHSKQVNNWKRNIVIWGFYLGNVLLWLAYDKKNKN